MEETKSLKSEGEKVQLEMEKAIFKEGEGFRLGDHPTFFEECGKRLFEPIGDAKKITGKGGFQKPQKGVTAYVMNTTSQQVIAYWVNGIVYITHHGQDRHNVNVKIYGGK